MVSSTHKVGNKPKKEYYCSMDKPFKILEPYQWNMIWLGLAHIYGVQGFYMLIAGEVPRATLIFSLLHMYIAGFGTTVGAHRLWTHKTFKAKLPLQILLAYMQTASAQYPIFKWCRDHRIHHKYVETDADPHDARRGFWFAHIGWLFQPYHPAMKEKEETIDFSDLDNDPVVRFQTKYYWYLLATTFFIIPISIQSFFWPEMTLYQLFCVNYIWYFVSVHVTWLVNSAAHIWGDRPFDGKINSRENPIVSLLAIGEGWHNYHHTFPWDYKASELGFYDLNWSTGVIDFFAWLGWAYDLKTVPEQIVKERVKRTGDGSHHHHHHQSDSTGLKDAGENSLPPWGWGDEDIPDEHYKLTESFKSHSAKSS